MLVIYLGEVFFIILEGKKRNVLLFWFRLFFKEKIFKKDIRLKFGIFVLRRKKFGNCD